MDHAEASRGKRLEAVVADRLAARVTRAISAIVEATQRPLDVGQFGLDLLEDREVLLALEGLRCDVGLMLAEVRELGGRLVLRLVVEGIGVETGADVLEAGARARGECPAVPTSQQPTPGGPG